MTTAVQRPARSGGIVAATWLIGLGLVFLLQQLLGWTWAEAWPLFIILIGVGSLTGVLVGRHRHRSLFAALAWPVGLLLIGVVLLLSTTGSLGTEPGELLAWWPVLLIAWGGWLLIAALLPGRRIGMDTMELPLGGTQGASVKIKFGGGELSVGPGPASMITGEFHDMPAKYRADPGGEIEIEAESPGDWPWLDRSPSWRIGLPTDLPVSLSVESGAAKSWLDLRDVRLEALRISTGASETRVRLPASAGATNVRADSGAASLTFEVPEGVAARIHGTMALGSLNVDAARFPRAGGAWQSPDFASAANRVDIEVQGGVGSVRVV